MAPIGIIAPIIFIALTVFNIANAATRPISYSQYVVTSMAAIVWALACLILVVKLNS